MFADTQIPLNYLTLLRTHQTAVTLSIVLFLARGIGVQARASWPMWSTVRWASVLIDVVLLASGISLWVLLAYNPVVHAWLGTKLLLLIVYIVLGSFALKRGRTEQSRRVFFAAALVCVLCMVGIALARHPGGWWLMLT